MWKNILTEGIHILTGGCKRVHDRHAAYRVVCLEGQLLGAGDGNCQLWPGLLTRRLGAPWGCEYTKEKVHYASDPVSELSSLPRAPAVVTVVAALMRKLSRVYWSWCRPMEFRIIRI